MVEIGGGDLKEGRVAGRVFQDVGVVNRFGSLGRVVVNVQHFDAHLDGAVGPGRLPFEKYDTMRIT